MKFCTKCGGQCVDEAVICVSCGSALAPVAAPTVSSAPVVPNVAPTPSATPVKSLNNDKLALFDFLSNISILLYTVAFYLSVVYAYTRESSSYWGYYSYTYFELDEIFFVIAAILAIPVVAFAILRLVAGLSHKGNLKVMLSGGLRLATAIIIVLISILTLVEYA